MPVEPLAQFELFEPEHDSLQRDRLRSSSAIAERVYAEHWKKLNTRHFAVNRGFTCIEWILCPSGRTPSPVSRRDAEVAACVIQWLGTNCGGAFLREAERLIEKIRDGDSSFGHPRSWRTRGVFQLTFHRPREFTPKRAIASSLGIPHD